MTVYDELIEILSNYGVRAAKAIETLQAEVEQLKAENERMNKENFWLSEGKEEGNG